MPDPDRPQDPVPVEFSEPRQVVSVETGHIVLFMAGYSAVAPLVTVNGKIRAGYWGQIPIELPPGRHHVWIGMPHLNRWTGEVRHDRRYGCVAELWVAVEAGQTVPVYYTPPMYQSRAGAIGFVPQRRPGRWVVPGFLVSFLLWWLLLIILAIAQAPQY